MILAGLGRASDYLCRTTSFQVGDRVDYGLCTRCLIIFSWESARSKDALETDDDLAIFMPNCSLVYARRQDRTERIQNSRSSLAAIVAIRIVHIWQNSQWRNQGLLFLRSFASLIQ
jgi:hypothetical protein